MVVMWHLWLVVTWEECGDNFQILGTASLQVLHDYSHGRASTLAADSKIFFIFYYNKFILVAYMISLYWHFTVQSLFWFVQGMQSYVRITWPSSCSWAKI
jgi:hypothetical protein